MANEKSGSQPHGIVLSEEEIFDIGLATFHSFDTERTEAAASARQLKGGPCAPVVRGGPCAPTVRGGPCAGCSLG
jgi:hypothetical protein